MTIIIYKYYWTATMQQEIKDRIISAAEELYAKSESGEFPNVEAVRQRSKASMNSVVEVLREWRHQQRQQFKTTREPLPVILQEEMNQLGQSIWETAQSLANESLDTARAAFESEKSDLAKLSAEQSEAFEGINTELEKTREESEHLRSELSTIRQSAKEEAERLSGELAQVKAKAEAAEQIHTERQNQMVAELERARREASEARESAATLRGQIEAMTSHNTALLAALAANTGKGTS